MSEKKPESAKEKSESLVAKLLNQLMEFIEPDGLYVYRGQENAGWEVESTAARRLRRNDMEDFPFVRYHEEVILEPARMDGHGIIDGRVLEDLELLANLRHHGTATCLIDFTRNFFVALWFACKGAETKDGKVFILNIKNREVFCLLSKDDLKCSIREILEFKTRIKKKDEKEPETFSPLYWSWAPHDINQRILKQDSLFIFGKNKKEIKKKYLKEILIPGESKLGVVEELRKLGITKESLFKDPPGFSSLHGPETPLPPEYKEIIKAGVDDAPTSDKATTYFQLGNDAFQRGNYPGAVQRYAQAIELNPSYADAHYNRGDANFVLGNHVEAIKDYSQAIHFKPGDALAYHNRANAKALLGEHTKAIEDYDQAIKHKKHYARAYYNRGVAKSNLSEYLEAIKDFDESIDSESDFAPAYYNRGVAKLNLGENLEAIKDYNESIRLDPDDALAYNNRGVAKANLDRYSEAIQDYSESIRLRPNAVPAYVNRGNAKLELNQYAEAIEDYNQAIKLDSSDARAYTNRGWAKFNLGKHLEARKDYDQAIRLNPADALAYINRGRVKLKLSDKDGASKDFLRAQELAEAQGNKELLKEIDWLLSKLDGEDTDK